MENDDLELEKLRLKRRKQLLERQAIIKPQTDLKEGEETKKVLPIPNGVIHLTEESFREYVKYATIPILIDYWAVWCEPCKYVAPIIEALERKFRGKMIFGKINVDEQPSFSSEFNIASIPTFHIWYKEKLIDQFVGALPGEKFLQRVNSILTSLKIN